MLEPTGKSNRTKRQRPRFLLPIVGIIVGGLLGLAYTIVSKPIYRAKAQILVNATESEGSGLNLFTGNVTTALSVLTGVFRSEAMAQFLSKESGIPRKDVSKVWLAVPDNTVSIMTVSAEHTNTGVALELVRKSIGKATELEMQGATDSASLRAAQLKKSLEAKLTQYNAQLEELGDELRSLRVPLSAKPEENLDVIRNAEQTELELKGIRSTIANLSAQKAAVLRQFELPKEFPGFAFVETLRKKAADAKQDRDALAGKLGPKEPRMIAAEEAYKTADALYEREARRAAESVVRGIDGQIGDLRVKESVLAWQAEHQAKLSQLAPREALQTKNLIERVKQSQAALSELESQYEIARIDAEVGRIRWTVLTPPYLEERPINKRFARYPLGGAAVGLGISVLLMTYLNSNRKGAMK